MPEPSLDRISELVKLLDQPQLTYPTVHITGTNGKTTTARLVTALACAHGLTTGTFVSPHLVSVTERLSVCGEAIPEREFAEEYARLLPYLERVDVPERKVTYFETLTALAYLWFADKPVALAVFEVGMGGAWDATNLVGGDVAVICPVGLDHMKYLGSTIASIATEKAGIIKEGRPAVIRKQVPEAMRAIERRAGEVGATLLVEGRAFRLESRTQGVGGQSITVAGVHGEYEGFFLPLFGEPAARNASAAIVACETLLGRALDEAAVRKALESVTAPGRLEVSARRPLVILDGAHNPDAARALVATLSEAFRWRNLHLVIGMFEDKEVEEVVGILSPITDRGYACRSSSERAAPVERIVSALSRAGVVDVESFPSVAAALDAAMASAHEEDLVLVTGSFYTVGDARPSLVGA